MTFRYILYRVEESLNSELWITANFKTIGKPPSAAGEYNIDEHDVSHD